MMMMILPDRVVDVDTINSFKYFQESTRHTLGHFIFC